MTFKELGLHDRLLEALSYMNFVNATPVQEQAIPRILEGKDVVACAQTGTGKTAAFVLPVLDKLSLKSVHAINTLVIVPTRELAIQIDQQLQGLSYFVPAGSYAIYGGGTGIEFEKQRRALEKGTEIIVATPGRLIAHLNLGYVKLDQLEHLILDEADRMLDMGFYPDIQRILSYVPPKRQTLMFSATMPGKIRKLAAELTDNPFEINISISKPAEGVTQQVYLAHNNQKTPTIQAILKADRDLESVLIFCSTKKKVSQVTHALKGGPYQVEAISSDLEQKARGEVLRRFKAGQTRVLVATDVLSRGIDIKGIHMVMNYDVPRDAEDYVHRVGRTARADAKGKAVTFVNDDDMSSFHRIEELIGYEIEKLQPPEHLGGGPVWKIKGSSRRPSSKGRSSNGGNRPPRSKSSGRQKSNRPRNTERSASS